MMWAGRQIDERREDVRPCPAAFDLSAQRRSAHPCSLDITPCGGCWGELRSLPRAGIGGVLRTKIGTPVPGLFVSLDQL